MKALVSRLKSLATKPLWTKGHVQKSRRRWRLVLALPFALLGGLTWGWFAVAPLPEGSRLLWSTLGAVSFGFFFYLEERLAPALAAAGERIGIGGFALLAWEVGVIGGLVYLVTGVLGAPTVPAVAIAVSVGALYSVAAEYLLFGGGCGQPLGPRWARQWHICGPEDGLLAGRVVRGPRPVGGSRRGLRGSDMATSAHPPSLPPPRRHSQPDGRPR